MNLVASSAVNRRCSRHAVPARGAKPRGAGRGTVEPLEDRRLLSASLAVVLPANSRIEITDGPVAGSGISEYVNLATGHATVFANPTQSLTFRYASGNKTSQLTFNGLDGRGAPADVSFALGTGDTTFTVAAVNGGGTSAANAVINFDTGDITAGGLTLHGGAAAQDLQFRLATANLTLVGGGSTLITPGTRNGDGISRDADGSDPSIFTDFKNPSRSLTFDQTGSDADDDVFGGLDGKSPPADVGFELGTGRNTFTAAAVNGGRTTATNAAIDFTTGDITADGLTLHGAAVAQDVDFLLATTNLTLDSGGGDVFTPGAVNGDGISRDADLADPKIFTDFRNPTRSLTYTQATGSADSVVFAGLDAKAAPPDVTFVLGTVYDTVTVAAVNGGGTTATNAAIDFATGDVTADGLTLHGAATAQDLQFLLATTNLTLTSGGGDVFTPGTTNGDGISRAASLADATVFTDFKNPTKSLTYVQATAADDTVVFGGLDSRAAPSDVTFDLTGSDDTFAVRAVNGGATRATNASINFVTGDIAADGLTLHGAAAAQDVQFLLATSDLALTSNSQDKFSPGTSNGDGISRDADPTDSSVFTDFENPSRSLTYTYAGTGPGAGSDVIYGGLDSKSAPPDIRFALGDGYDTFAFAAVNGGKTSATNGSINFATGDITADGLTLHGVATAEDLEYLVATRNLTIVSGGGDAFSPGATAGDGISRDTSLTDPSIFTDFENPTGTFAYRYVGTDSDPNVLFNGLDGVRKPAHIIFDF